MTDPQPCRVIGVLDDGAASLGATALAHLRRADLVIGGARTLALFDDDIAPAAVRRDLTGQLGAGAYVNVSAPVPEPATVALMLAGVGLVGAATRRRAAKGTAA